MLLCEVCREYLCCFFGRVRGRLVDEGREGFCGAGGGVLMVG